MKQAVCFLAYVASTLLWTIANPRGLWQTVAQSGGQILAVARRLRHKGEGDPAPAGAFSLPFHGTWTVVNGGVDRQTSHSWSLVAQRYAYDFVITGDDGLSHTGAGERPEDYHCFGQPILAAADGEVVSLRDDVVDDGRCGSCWIDWRTRDIRGNYVVIKHAAGVYSLSAHLQQGSIAVAVGDHVQRGQVIGRCGNTGHSTEPHLHFQVQDHPDFYLAVGLPIRFAQFAQQPFVEKRVEGAEVAIASGYLVKNHRVRALESATDERMAAVAPQIGGMDLLVSLGIFVLGVVGITYIFTDIIGGLLRLIF